MKLFSLESFTSCVKYIWGVLEVTAHLQTRADKSECDMTSKCQSNWHKVGRTGGRTSFVFRTTEHLFRFEEHLQIKLKPMGFVIPCYFFGLVVVYFRSIWRPYSMCKVYDCTNTEGKCDLCRKTF